MNFIIEVDEKIIEAKIKSALLGEINTAVQRAVINQIGKYESDITKAVDVHLAKRLTNEEIKSEIDKAVKIAIERNLDKEY